MSSASRSSKQPIWDWPTWMKGSMPNPIDVFAAPENLTHLRFGARFPRPSVFRALRLGQ